MGGGCGGSGGFPLLAYWAGEAFTSGLALPFGVAISFGEHSDSHGPFQATPIAPRAIIMCMCQLPWGSASGQWQARLGLPNMHEERQRLACFDQAS